MAAISYIILGLIAISIGILAERKRSDNEYRDRKERCVLSVSVVNRILKDRDGYYIITRIEEIGILKGLKYFELWVMEYDLLKKEVRPGAEEIELTLAENLIEKAENVQIVQEGMLGFNNGGILKIFQRP